MCALSVYLCQCNTVHTACNVDKLPEKGTAYFTYYSCVHPWCTCVDCLQNSFSPLWKEEYGGSEEMLLVSRITCVCIISVYLRQCNTIHTDCNVEKLPEEDTAAAGFTHNSCVHPHGTCVRATLFTLLTIVAGTTAGFTHNSWSGVRLTRETP